MTRKLKKEFCSIINVFTVTFYQFIVSFLNKDIFNLNEHKYF